MSDRDPIDDPVGAVQARLPGSVHVPAADRGRRVIHDPTGTELVSGRRFEPSRWIDRRSSFGNPFKLTEDGGDIDSRERSVALYEGWFKGQLLNNDDFAAAVDDLYGETLGCWCLPERCHGEVILRYLVSAADSPGRN